MIDPTISIVISSSIVSGIVSIAMTLFTLGKYKQKVDSLEKNFEKN